MYKETATQSIWIPDLEERYEIPAYCDLWMRGARFGSLVKVTTSKKRYLTPNPDIAHIRLDATGKVHRFIFDDCRAA